MEKPVGQTYKVDIVAERNQVDLTLDIVLKMKGYDGTKIGNDIKLKSYNMSDIVSGKISEEQIKKDLENFATTAKEYLEGFDKNVEESRINNSTSPFNILSNNKTYH